MSSMASGAMSVAAAKMLGLVASFGSTLVTVRAVSAAFGESTYGAVALVSTLVTLVPVADLGMGLVLVGITVDATNRRSFSRLRRTYGAIWWLVGVVALVALASSVLISASIGWEPLLGTPSRLLGDPDVYMPFYVLVAGAWLVTGLWLRLLMGLQRPVVLALAQSLGPVVAAATVLVTAWLGGPPLVAAFASMCGAIFANCVAGYAAYRSLSQLGGRVRIIPPNRIRRGVWSMTARSGLSGVWFSIGGALIFAVDRILLSNWSDPSQLAEYSLAVPLFSGVQGALGAIGTFLWPRYAQMKLRNEIGPRLLWRHWTVSTGIGLLVAVLMILTYPLYYWAAGVAQGPPILLVAFAVVAVLQASTLPLTSAHTAENLLRIQGLGLSAAVVVKVVLAAVLVPILGATGVVAATAGGIILAQLPVLFWLQVRAARE